MRRAILTVGLLLLTLPGLTGCAVTLGPVTERETIWARMGTPARIVDQRPIDVLVPDGKGNWKRTQAVMGGMMGLDEPTFEVFQRNWEQSKGGAILKKQTDL
jgi:hypothetical protein